jgi:hypothetical protein
MQTRAKMKFKIIMGEKSFIHHEEGESTIRELYRAIREKVMQDVFIFRSSPRSLVEMTDLPVSEALANFECLYLSSEREVHGPVQASTNTLSTVGLHFSVHQVPSDNSCLFHSLSELLSAKSSGALRSIVADTILREPQRFSMHIEMSPFEFSKWISAPDTWGGATEIVIISQMYKTQVCVIDVYTLFPLFFGEEFKNIVYLVYTKDHYNPVFARTREGKTQHKFLANDKDVRDRIQRAVKEWGAHMRGRTVVPQAE